MKISIITPVYNEPRIQQTLDSILSQRGLPELETIVVDGESTDETATILEEYSSRIDVLIREPDEGVYDAMNKGIELATGDVVGILNADDRYNDDQVLKDVMDSMQKSEADLCYGDLVYVDSNDEVVRYWRSGPFRRFKYYFGWMPPHPTFFVREDVYDEFGDFDLSFPIAADYELMLRFLLKYDLSITYVDRVLVRMATGGQSNESIRNILQANWEVWRAWQKNSIPGGQLAPIAKPLRKIPQYIRGYA